ncbi:MAG: accessory factor UbiK family protein [Burkholderiaceae bacterium]|nr:accessory factor UbiK family protein [Burkholderiaceae bacterium]
MDRTRPSLFGDFQERIGELLRNSPAADVERNLKALSAQFFDRLELVTRDELDAQRAQLDRLRERVEALEAAAQKQAAEDGGPEATG